MNKAIPWTVIRYVIAVFCIFILACCASFRNEERYYEKQEEKLAKQEQRDYEQKVKEHRNMQSKQTLKMMKEAERQARKMNKRRER